ncbi:MAG: S8 family peptidase, partial [Acidobacteria bacterium]|nr:S8 family peptidase [Acidobacteriota bacterium]
DGTTDQYGHGTHVAGIIAGTGSRSSGAGYSETFSGIAPAAKIVSLRVLDQNGSGTDADVISAINTAIQLKSKYNIRVINLSLGRPVFESYAQDPLCQAVERAWNAGIVVVVAAGNYGRAAATNGYGTITAPGNDPYVITVGAMKDNGTPQRNDDTIASYSSKGPTLFDHIIKPDLVAPGNRIVSVDAPGSYFEHVPSTNIAQNAYTIQGASAVSTSYRIMSGTSMAAPVVSGAVALMLQQSPALTPDQVKVRLMESASKSFPAFSTATDPQTGVTYTSQYDAFTVGAGYLDINAALSDTNLTHGPALSPAAKFNSNGNVTMVIAPGSAFANSIMWGASVSKAESIVWGANVVNSNSLLWGASILWGTNTDHGFSILWGASSDSSSSILWGANGDNSTSILWSASDLTTLANGEN